MVTRRKYVSGVVAVIALGGLGAGCETAGLDSLPNVGLADTFVGKKGPEPDLKENPPLKMPPANASLPVPGQGAQVVASTDAQASADSGQPKKQKNGG